MCGGGLGGVKEGEAEVGMFCMRKEKKMSGGEPVQNQPRYMVSEFKANVLVCFLLL